MRKRKGTAKANLKDPRTVSKWVPEILAGADYNYSYDFRDQRLARGSKTKALDVMLLHEVGQIVPKRPRSKSTDRPAPKHHRKKFKSAIPEDFRSYVISKGLHSSNSKEVEKILEDDDNNDAIDQNATGDDQSDDHNQHRNKSSRNNNEESGDSDKEAEMKSKHDTEHKHTHAKQRNNNNNPKKKQQNDISPQNKPLTRKSKDAAEQADTRPTSPKRKTAKSNTTPNPNEILEHSIVTGDASDDDAIRSNGRNGKDSGGLEESALKDSQDASLPMLPLPNNLEITDSKQQRWGEAYCIPFYLTSALQKFCHNDSIRRAPDAPTPTPYIKISKNIITYRPTKTFKVEVCGCHKHASPSHGRCVSNCINRDLKIECARGHCLCGDACQNQKFQRNEYKRLNLFKTVRTGFGLVAGEAIEDGEFVIEYVGEVIDDAEARRRIQTYKHESNFYLLTIHTNEVIDASRKGNLARFINHSCDPSCETQKWTVLGEIRVGVFAKRRMNAGEEVTIDYNFERIGGSNEIPCMCGSSNCRGFLGGSKRPEELKKKSEQDLGSKSTRIESSGVGLLRRRTYAASFSPEGILKTLPTVCRLSTRPTVVPNTTNAMRHRRRCPVFLVRNKRSVRCRMFHETGILQEYIGWDAVREQSAALTNLQQRRLLWRDERRLECSDVNNKHSRVVGFVGSGRAGELSLEYLNRKRLKR